MIRRYRMIKSAWYEDRNGSQTVCKERRDDNKCLESVQESKGKGYLAKTS